jgi:glycosyltransferase involved in cell wall biosynthesis
MIVKNEEENIERALTWGKNIVSEQIVVDTGSTDRTVELAEAMGAKVCHFEWIDDFAAAKNFAIEQASGDWIFFLDADEYLTKEDAQKIPVILPQIEKMKIRKKKVDLVMCTLCNLDVDGNVGEVIEQVRLFRNLPHIRYEGRIHEMLVGLRKRQLTTLDVKDSFVVYHTGYAWTPQTREKKMERNIALLKKELDKEPDNAVNQLYLAEAFLVKQEYAEAVKYAKAALKNAVGQEWLKERLRMAHQIVLRGTYDLMKGGLAADDADEFCRLYEDAAAFAPDEPEYDAIMGYYMFDSGRYGEAAFYLEQTLAKMDAKEDFNPGGLTSDIKSLSHFLAVSYARIGNDEKFFSYAVQTLRFDSKQDEIVELLIEYLTNKDPATAEQIYEFLQQIYHFDMQKDVVYLLRMALRTGNQELVEMLKGDLTQENRGQLFGE